MEPRKVKPHPPNKLPQDFPAPWLRALTSLPWSRVSVCFTPSQLLGHILNHLQNHNASIPLTGHKPSLLRWLWQVPSTLSRPSVLWFYHCLSYFFFQFNSFKNKSIPPQDNEIIITWGCGSGVSIFQSSLVIIMCSWVENHCSTSEHQNIQFSS